MVINGIDLPSIGLIRVKPIGDGGLYTLTIYPPGDGPLAGMNGATIAEITVDEAEVRRIETVAPHLVTKSIGAQSALTPATACRRRPG